VPPSTTGLPTDHTHRRPASAVVVGAGMVGLATAWFLQERGVAVTVVDRDEVAAGSSWGDAGWLPPGLAINAHALDAYDQLAAGGVDVATGATPAALAAFDPRR
jgi:glycine/D-amino acid oxidase-like deaminating enzyme